jgi:hypothetical protein
VNSRNFVNRSGVVGGKWVAWSPGRLLAAVGLCLLGLGLFCPAHVQSAPANDHFANRIQLSGLSVATTGSNVNATKESGEYDHNVDDTSDHGGKSVWWTWTAPETRHYTFSTVGSNFDTVLALYVGTDVATLGYVGGIDSGPGGPQALLQGVFIAIGTEIQVVVDGYAGPGVAASGNISLSITAENDEFDDALTLTGSNLITTGSNVFATVEGSELGPIAPLDLGGKSVWWKWTAPVSGKVTISTAGSDFDTVLGLYSGSTLEEAVRLMGNDDDAGGGRNTSRIDFDVTAGTEYRILVDGLAGFSVAASGNIVLTLGMNNVAATLGTTGIVNQQLGLTVQGGIGSSYRLESSPDLANWVAIQHFVPTNAVTSFTDSVLPGNRFYRVVSPDVPVVVK